MSYGPEDKARTARIEAEKRVSDEGYHDPADVVWEPTVTGLKPQWVLLYEDRPLRWRERLMMWLFRRRDPRILGTADFGVGAIKPESLSIEWDPEGIKLIPGIEVPDDDE